MGIQMGKITPYDYQQEIIDAINNHIRSEWREKMKARLPVDPVFVEAYVSAGKTIMIGGVANHCTNIMKSTGKKLNVMVLASIGELVEQNSEECWNMSAPNSQFSASIGVKSMHYPIVVGTSGTVANALDKQFAQWAPHIILIDECHEVDWREVMMLEKDPARDTSNQYAKIICHFRRLNPAVAIIGFTGTPYRGLERIDGRNSFWKRRIGPKIDREFLVENGYIVPTIFGVSDIEYDLHDFDGDVQEEGTQDFDAKKLDKMSTAAMDQKTADGDCLTHAIMRDVMEKTKHRHGVLITCASEKHCRQAAEVIQGGEYDVKTKNGDYCIITQSTKKADRRAMMKAIKKGVIKYTFQIGCLTTGVNVPFWDTSVIMRRIGSLTLLTQLLGRGMRLLKDEHMSMGWSKGDHMVLDYSGTMERMHQLFDNPILDEAADASKKKKPKGDLKICKDCNYENAPTARRCMGTIKSKDGDSESRCEHFWKFIECKNKDCKAKNSPGAKECRKCGHQLVDPNKKLSGKHYGPDDWKTVRGMSITPTRNGNGLAIRIDLECKTIDGRPEVAQLFFSPFSSEGAKRIWQTKFVNVFVRSWPDRKLVMGLKSIDAIMAHLHLFAVPTEITHRINDKNKSVVNGVKFGDIENRGGKDVAA